MVGIIGYQKWDLTFISFAYENRPTKSASEVELVPCECLREPSTYPLYVLTTLYYVRSPLSSSPLSPSIIFFFITPDSQLIMFTNHNNDDESGDLT